MSPRSISLVVGMFVLASSASRGPAQDPGPIKTAANVRLDRTGDPLPAGAVARLGTTRFRHLAGVFFVGHSGDGKTLLTLSGENVLRFWDVQTGQEVRGIPVKRSRPSLRIYPFRQGPSVLLSGDGKTLVLGGNEGSCSVITVATGKVEREFKIGDDKDERFPGGRTMFLSRDGRLLVILDGDEGRGRAGRINVWSATDGKLLRTVNPKNKDAGFSAATLSHDGATLLTVEGRDDRKDGEPGSTQLRFTNVMTGMEIKSVASPLTQVSEVQLTRDGKHVLVRDQQAQNVHLVDAATGKEVRQFAVQQGIRGMLQAPDGKTLFIAGLGHAIQYDIETGMERKKFVLSGGSAEDFVDDPFEGRSTRYSMTISPDGKTLAVPDHAGIAFWDVHTGKEKEVVQGHRDRIDSVAFAPGGKQVLTGSTDSRLYLWEGADGRRLQALLPKDTSPDEAEILRRGRIGNMTSLYRVKGRFTPDGKHIAALWWGGKLHLWDAAGAKLQHHLGGPAGSTAYAFSTDGKLVALAGQDGVVRLFDPASGRQVRTLGKQRETPSDEMERFGPDIEQSICSLAFAADGRTLIQGEMHMEPLGMSVDIRFWELATGKERQRLQHRAEVVGAAGGVSFDTVAAALDGFIASFLFSPDGKTMAEAGFSTIKLRDLRTGKEIRAFGGKQIVGASARFSPDGKLLLAGTHDGAIRLWDLATGTVLVDFPAHRGAVTALDFSSDGKWLASGSRDTTVLIWDWDHIRSHVKGQGLATENSKFVPLWTDLASPDAAKAYQSIKAIVSTPHESVAFLKARLKPIPPVDPAHVAKLVDDLDHAQFAVRQQAEQSLEKLGDIAAAAIKDRLAASPPLEMGRRLESLQKKLDAQVMPAEVLQALRTIETLELIGTPEARQVLDGLARGAAGHRVTEEARKSLRRLQ